MAEIEERTMKGPYSWDRAGALFVPPFLPARGLCVQQGEKICADCTAQPTYRQIDDYSELGHNGCADLPVMSTSGLLKARIRRRLMGLQSCTAVWTAWRF